MTLDLPGGPNVITSIFKSERGRQESQRPGRYDDKSRGQGGEECQRRDPEPRNGGSLWNLGNARKWIHPQSLLKGMQAATDILISASQDHFGFLTPEL